MDKKIENGAIEVSPIVAENMFLREIVIKLEQTKHMSLEEEDKLKKIFSSLKNFKATQKCLYEVVLALGLTRVPEYKALASEFNNKLNNYQKNI